MDENVEFNNLEEALNRCGASWDAAQTHGLLTGRLAVVGVPAGPDWLLQVLEGTEDVGLRTAALAHWCEGSLHGLVSVKHADALKERLAAEPLADIIKDMLQMTRAGLDEECDDESDDAAYAELVEYLRVAAQLSYEELAEFRNERTVKTNE